MRRPPARHAPFERASQSSGGDEGWAVVGGQPASTGKFNVAGDGSLRTPSGAPIAGGRFPTSLALGSASAIVITIEPAGDTDTTLPFANRAVEFPRGTATIP